MKKIEKLAQDLMNVQLLLAATKKEELALRKALAEQIQLETLSVGTHNIDEGHFRIKAVRKVSYSLDRAALENAWEDLPDDQKDAVDWKPTLSLKIYKILDDTSMIDEYIEVKPAMPTITIQHIGDW